MFFSIETQTVLFSPGLQNICFHTYITIYKLDFSLVSPTFLLSVVLSHHLNPLESTQLGNIKYIHITFLSCKLEFHIH